MADTKPFFDSMKKSFADVPIDAANGNGIATVDFLGASESLCGLFDVLGSAAFKPVKSDIMGNVKKIRERHDAAPGESATLQDLVRNELKTKKHVATEGLLWLTRGLDFTAQALRHNQVNSTEELSTSFRTAYGETLKPHHGLLIKPIFSAAMSATPYRKDFYAKLFDDEAKGKEQMEIWLAALEQRVAILKTFMASSEAKWN